MGRERPCIDFQSITAISNGLSCLLRDNITMWSTTESFKQFKKSTTQIISTMTTPQHETHTERELTANIINGPLCTSLGQHLPPPILRPIRLMEQIHLLPFLNSDTYFDLLDSQHSSNPKGGPSATACTWGNSNCQGEKEETCIWQAGAHKATYAIQRSVPQSHYGQVWRVSVSAEICPKS